MEGIFERRCFISLKPHIWKMSKYCGSVRMIFEGSCCILEGKKRFTIWSPAGMANFHGHDMKHGNRFKTGYDVRISFAAGSGTWTSDCI